MSCVLKTDDGGEKTQQQKKQSKCSALCRQQFLRGTSVSDKEFFVFLFWQLNYVCVNREFGGTKDDGYGLRTCSWVAVQCNGWLQNSGREFQVEIRNNSLEQGCFVLL